jgi:hypothetical protein
MYMRIHEDWFQKVIELLPRETMMIVMVGDSDMFALT